MGDVRDVHADAQQPVVEPLDAQRVVQVAGREGVDGEDAHRPEVPPCIDLRLGHLPGALWQAVNHVLGKVRLFDALRSQNGGSLRLDLAGLADRLAHLRQRRDLPCLPRHQARRHQVVGDARGLVAVLRQLRHQLLRQGVHLDHHARHAGVRRHQRRDAVGLRHERANHTLAPGSLLQYRHDAASRPHPGVGQQELRHAAQRRLRAARRLRHRQRLFPTLLRLRLHFLAALLLLYS
mmetsp:Transcript_23216/g.58303  ORF Transcript_23216/g.58303 Transcript_23216/m.58303 type:complete len:236 (-) Transcript_23216:816-1523(-)